MWTLLPAPGSPRKRRKAKEAVGGQTTPCRRRPFGGLKEGVFKQMSGNFNAKIKTALLRALHILRKDADLSVEKL